MIVVSTSLIPFLELNGSADEAIDFYVKALDAKVVNVLRLGDSVPEKKDWITYAILKR
jgi:PhnB protein